MNQVAVIILNYNTSTDCRKCVSFLKRQQGIEMEIIIVDNCSRQDDRKKVEALCQEQGCTFIAATENRGYNVGNNIGLRYAADKGYKYALIANPDMEFPQTDYLQKMVGTMEQHNDVVVCGSDIVSPEGLHQNPIKRDGDWGESFGWIYGFLKLKMNDTYDFIENYKENHYCSKVSGCCLLVRLDFIENIEFFDENVFLYCEEAILSRQVEHASKRMFYLATTQAVHRHIKSEKGNPVKRLKAWRKSRTYFIQNYSDDSKCGKYISIISLWIYLSIIIGSNQIKQLWK